MPSARFSIYQSVEKQKQKIAVIQIGLSVKNGLLKRKIEINQNGTSPIMDSPTETVVRSSCFSSLKSIVICPLFYLSAVRTKSLKLHCRLKVGYNVFRLVVRRGIKCCVLSPCTKSNKKQICLNYYVNPACNKALLCPVFLIFLSSRFVLQNCQISQLVLIGSSP